MSITERVFELMKIKNITQVQLKEVLEIQQSTISNWKNRGSDIPSKYIKPICDILNVSTDYLLTGMEAMHPNPLTPKQIENEFFNTYKALTHDEQIKIIGKLELIAEQSKENESCTQEKGKLSS